MSGDDVVGGGPLGDATGGEATVGGGFGAGAREDGAPLGRGGGARLLPRGGPADALLADAGGEQLPTAL